LTYYEYGIQLCQLFFTNILMTKIKSKFNPKLCVTNWYTNNKIKILIFFRRRTYHGKRESLNCLWKCWESVTNSFTRKPILPNNLTLPTTLHSSAFKNFVLINQTQPYQLSLSVTHLSKSLSFSISFLFSSVQFSSVLVANGQHST